MTLTHVAKPVVVNTTTMCPVFPMRDGATHVDVNVLPVALEKLGCDADYLSACKMHRHRLEKIASDKYGRRADGALVITLADVA